ncbi:CheR family methyltransferase [Rhizobium alvei]|uniref:histidine kinase n=1 Tax=Rhizobium alvei TaxID=1132659 RepID=A0ABT8YP13_9HYPH|nr:CheR family methyltransferase [Rhizobium alvei]MDO6965461.1 CheR family methyltransferase [Rhizobium alvei]
MVEPVKMDKRSLSRPRASKKVPPAGIIAIGASAGGLEACKKLLAGGPPLSDFAFVLVQHLDPHQENLLVDLVSHQTRLTVVEAKDGAPLEAGFLHVIPPGRFLTVRSGRIAITRPDDAKAVRMPIDVLLASLAADCGPSVTAIILSGTGTDGTEGCAALQKAGGKVLVQDPQDAAFPGMPQSVIASGNFDQIDTADHLLRRIFDQSSGRSSGDLKTLGAIINHLRRQTVHDFSDYKRGTIERRVAQRMASHDLDAGDMEAYLNILKKDAIETTRLANDILIHVTGFFRDPPVFDAMSRSVIPEIIDRCATDHTIRVWVAGCSTGEEAYSIAILFLECFSARNGVRRLQIFASDVDSESVAQARAGFYPASIEADVSAERLHRYFVREGAGYRVTAELRDCVIFSVQDLLNDPPFSHLDLISCRNVLIYLTADAQSKLLSIFHFALADDGLLLLGNVETANGANRQFDIAMKELHLWRRTKTRRNAVAGFELRQPQNVKSARAARQLTPLASLCQRLITDHFAPAAVLIDESGQILYSIGPIDRYLRVPTGYPSHDLLAMLEIHLRADIATLIETVVKSGQKELLACAQPRRDDVSVVFDVLVLPVTQNSEPMGLVCFVDRKPVSSATSDTAPPSSLVRINALERELVATRAELQSTINNLEQASEEQRIINEEALSFNEEYQSTNEELVSSKEELQSLNEELTALNTQLQETLERQRTTSDDLQNVLYSTDVATIFLDINLKIRFFTPATRTIFNIIISDIGRPLSDLKSTAPDESLIDDAHGVLEDGQPRETEIRTRQGTWFIRRISPYLAMEKDLEGVVITFSDITERKHISEALEAAKKQAQSANAAKSRFLAAASHDLRQPLQTLTLLQGLLAQTVKDEKGASLVSRYGDTLNAMSGMLNTLLDINQIEAGTIKASYTTFEIGPLLETLRSEFDLQARALGLRLVMVPSKLVVTSDRALLGQMLRNLLSNALKYTKAGKVLFGCRRRGQAVSIEVWDTGIGIPESEFLAIFDEFHQLDNGARERSRGLGLGLSIVKRLSEMLGHKIELRSLAAKGSAFGILVNVNHDCGAAPPEVKAGLRPRPVPANTGKRPILLIEDDPQVRELLVEILTYDGQDVVIADDGHAAIRMVKADAVHPAMIIADYNLPLGLTGLAASLEIRAILHNEIPVMILTGDISTATIKEISAVDCLLFNKPVHTVDLLGAIRTSLAKTGAHDAARERATSAHDNTERSPKVYVIDDDEAVREAIRTVLAEAGYTVLTFDSCEAFLADYAMGDTGCILVDAYLPGLSGLDLILALKKRGDPIPSIMITAYSDVSLAVRAMRAGAANFIEKPVGRAELLSAVADAQAQAADQNMVVYKHEDAVRRMAGLTERQRQIMTLVLAGHPNKNIAADLGISQRTVENHRASIMKRTGSKSLPALARLAVAAGS